MHPIMDHYDRLVEENNDPVMDEAPLRAYMDLWDGPPFLAGMGLNGAQRVLEIGVGTGRLAVRIAPLCSCFFGVDLSEKSILRARQHLKNAAHVHLIQGDFLTCCLPGDFDVIYSSLTWMHFQDKQAAMNRAARLLAEGGTFHLSIDKNPSHVIDMGTRRIRIYPDNPDAVCDAMGRAGLQLLTCRETEMAHFLIARK